MSKTKGVGEKIPWDKLEDIEILKENPRQELSKFFKKYKKLVVTQILKISTFNRNTVISELQRMEDDRLVTKTRLPVRMPGEHQARSMFVFEWNPDGRT